MWLPPTYWAVVVGSWPGTAWLFKLNKFYLLIERRTIGVDQTFMFLGKEKTRQDEKKTKSWLTDLASSLPLKPSAMGARYFPCTIFHQHRWTQTTTTPLCLTGRLQCQRHCEERCQRTRAVWPPPGAHDGTPMGSSQGLWLSPSVTRWLIGPDRTVTSWKGGANTKRDKLPRSLFTPALLFPVNSQQGEENQTSVRSASSYSDSPHP